MTTRVAVGTSIAEFEALRRTLALDILGHCKDFMAHDMEMNANFARMTRLTADYMERQPEISGDAGPRREPGGLAEMGDLSGGALDWDFVNSIIDKISGVLGHEKPFIQKIIEAVFQL